MIRNHVRWPQELAQHIGGQADFEICSSPVLSLFSFRFRPERFGRAGDELSDSARDALNALNLRLLESINRDGRTYLTQTRIGPDLVIRFQVGPFECTRDHVWQAWDAVAELARH